MKELRMDIRWAADDPVTPLLAGIPRGQRTKIVQAIVSAALLPGGWAKLMNGTVTANAIDADRPLSPAPEREGSAEPTPPTAGSSQFVNALRRFGAFDDD